LGIRYSPLRIWAPSWVPWPSWGMKVMIPSSNGLPLRMTLPVTSWRWGPLSPQPLIVLTASAPSRSPKTIASRLMIGPLMDRRRGDEFPGWRALERARRGHGRTLHRAKDNSFWAEVVPVREMSSDDSEERFYQVYQAVTSPCQSKNGKIGGSA